MPANLFNIGRYFSKNSDDASNSSLNSNLNSNAPFPKSDNSNLSHAPLTDEKSSDKKEETAPLEKTEGAVKSSGLKQENDPLQKRSSMDILSRLTQRSNKCLMSAAGKARELKSSYIDTEHVLWGLLQDSGVYELISTLKITPSDLILEVEKIFKAENNENQPKFSPRVKKILELSLSYARSLGYEFISPEHILVSLSSEGEGMGAQVLGKHQLTPEKLKSKVGGKKEREEKEEKSVIVKYTTDLTQMARDGKLDPVVARSQEIERIMHILSRRTKNNPVLIGDAGVGKTAIVEGLAERIISQKVPQNLLNKKILALDLMSVIAGAAHRGEFEERLKKIIAEIKSSKGEIILFIDEIHNIIGAGGGGSGAMDASNILKPALARGEMQTIGVTTVSEYRKYIEKDPAFERRFQPIFVREPNLDEAVEMLTAIKDRYESYHKVSIPQQTIVAAVKLSSRYIGDRFLPDKAIDLIDEGASAVRLPAISLPEEIRSMEEKIKRLSGELLEVQKIKDQLRIATIQKEIQDLKDKLSESHQKFEVKKGQTTSVVTPEVIEEIVSSWTGIPIARLTESESDKLVKLEDILHKRLIDQEEAVSAVSEAIRRGRAGLSSGKRPIGSFIFMGPTGVGKTELAKTLAETLFGSEEMMVRLDMTEYMEKHEVAKLIGAPPGYVGYEEGGQLTEAVRRKPYSVVLLDEIEKANPDVFNILLQILDDGRLTDNKGRTINFKNTILICTSNLGTGIIQEELLSSDNDNPTILKKEENLNTYVITPTGREIATAGNTLWQKEDKKVWLRGSLDQYFAGQKVTGLDILNPQEKFPTVEFNTHTVSPAGEEEITCQGRIWRRNSTIAKEWESFSLVDYLAYHQVVNAKPDNPEEQLPTAEWETHAISPQEVETITLRDRIWIRENRQSKNWTTKKIGDYLENARKINLSFWDMHLFSENGEEIVIVGKKAYLKVGLNWQEEKLTDFLKGDNPPLSNNEEEVFDDKLMHVSEKLLELLRKFFRPELLNRFDEIIIFKPLTANHMLAIVSLQLDGVAKLLSDQGIVFEATDGAKEELTLAGFDPVFGARPLRRTIQRLVENPISNMLIKREIKVQDKLIIDFDIAKNEFFFNVKRDTPITQKQEETKQTEELKAEEKKEEKTSNEQIEKTEMTEPEKEIPQNGEDRSVLSAKDGSNNNSQETTANPVENKLPSFKEFYKSEKPDSSPIASQEPPHTDS